LRLLSLLLLGLLLVLLLMMAAVQQRQTNSCSRLWVVLTQLPPAVVRLQMQMQLSQ
jgi:hypothetical protein